MQEQKISISCVDTIKRQSGERPKGFHIVYKCSRRVDVETLSGKIRSLGVDVEELQSDSETDDLAKLGILTSIIINSRRLLHASIFSVTIT